MKLKQFYRCINPVLFSIGLLALSSCAASGVNIRQLATENYNDRVRYLVIHHTVVDYQESVDIFTNELLCARSKTPQTVNQHL